MNNQQNKGQQLRIIAAVVLSFLFFIVYSEFFVEKVPRDLNASNNASALNEASASLGANESATNQAPVSNSAPSVSSNTAPLINNANLNSAQNAQNTPQVFNPNAYISELESDKFIAQIDALGRIASFKLKGDKFKDEKGQPLELINAQGVKPLELRFSDNALNNLAFSTAYTASLNRAEIAGTQGVELILEQNLSADLSVQKRLIFFENGNYELSVNLNKPNTFFIALGARPNTAKESYVVRGALVVTNDGKIETFEDGDISANSEIAMASIVSAFDAYYASLFFDFSKPLDTIISNDGSNNALAFIRAQQNLQMQGYIGAKEHSTLRNIDERLIEAIEYGWFTFIAKPAYSFLEFLYEYIGNWGWSIVVLTLIVRVVLFPLTYKSMISMNKLKDLAPRLKELREKYKGDPQKMNVQMMELYKKHGANPFAGCLPILLQIPIFFAIYRVLLNAVELKGAAWALWIHDLSVLDPYYVLPIFMGATMFLQQLITPMAIQDPMQARIFKFLPVIFTFFFLWFPAGLTLYWCVNNLCSLAQQYIVNKLFAREHHKKEAKNEN